MAGVEIENTLFDASFVADTSAPALAQDGAVLNLHTGTLILQFNDVVNKESFDASGIYFQDKSSASTSSVGLSTSSKVNTTVSKTGYSVTVQLSTADLNQIKNDYNVASGIDNTYITMQSLTVEDPYGNNCVAVVDDKL
jgi:hypothetical protein